MWCAAAVTEAGLMTHEDLVRAEGVPACYLVDPSGTWSIGSWTVHDCQLFWEESSRPVDRVRWGVAGLWQ